MTNGNITKIRLSNNTVYNIVDAGALKVDKDGRILTPNATLNQIIINNNLDIVEINEVPLADAIDNLLTVEEVTINKGTPDEIKTQRVKKRNVKYILEDIGGQVQVDTQGSVLELKVGKGDYHEDY
jgi:hypothetical protein